MSATLMLGLLATMVATAFLSGIFGMAGGLILMGVLLAILPLPEAMALHAVTQMASNGWRGLLWWRHIRWRAAATFLGGCALAFLVSNMNFPHTLFYFTLLLCCALGFIALYRIAGQHWSGTSGNR